MATSGIEHNPLMPVAGEAFSFDLGCSGFISTDTKFLYLWAPTNRIINEQLTISSSQITSCVLDARSSAGPLVSYADMKPYLKKMSWDTSGQIYLEFEKSDRWGSTNNIPVSGHIALVFEV